MAKLVQIKINQTDYDGLKSGKYYLCFAQKANDTYAVVCQSISNYLPSTRISWLANYQLFGSNFFTAGVGVVVETNAVDIKFIEVATLDAAGMLKPAGGVGSSPVLAFFNNYGPIHPGLIGSSAGPDGVQRQLPIYVGRDAIEAGVIGLTPVDVVRVWFQQDITSGTMLSLDMLAKASNAIEVDLTSADTASLQYQNGAWSTIASN
jgi:hypothetical protein